MSVRDRIKLFEKANTLPKPTSVSPPNKRNSGVASSLRQTISTFDLKCSPPRTSQYDSQSFRIDKPVAHEAYALGSPELCHKPKEKIACPSPSDVSPRTVLAAASPCQLVSESFSDQTYYEVDAHFISSLLKMNAHSTINHSLVLRKPLFPKPCLYIG
jgi:hypothetical protein